MIFFSRAITAERIAATLIGSLCLAPWLAQAAVVPAGTVLADKQEIVRNNGSEPASLDAQKVESDVEFNIINDFFEGLVSIDKDGKVQPRLAQSWENENNTRWVFHLRPGLTWSNGDPLTANDVVFSWRRLIDPATASPYESYLQNMHVLNADAIVDGKMKPEALGIKALDAQTVEITLSQPVSYLLAMLPHASLVPLSQKALEKYGDKWTQPGNLVSSGPYTLSQWVVNEKLIGVRNTHYWDDKHTVINKVTYLPITSATADVNRYRAGEIDVTYTIPEIQFASLKKELGDQVHVTPKMSVYYYHFNTQKAPFNDARVRQALNLALDKGIIAEKVLGMGQTPAWSVGHFETGGYKLTPPDYAGWSQQQRNEKAKALLNEAGFNQAHPLSFTLLYNTSESHQRIAIAASSMWKKNLGVVVKLQNQEWKTMLDTMRTGDFQVVRGSWSADYNEPSTFLNNFTSHDSNNTTKFSNADYDRVMKEASTAATPEQAGKDYQQAENILAEQVPTIPLYYYVSGKLVKPWVGGFSISPMDYLFTKDMYIIKH